MRRIGRAFLVMVAGAFLIGASAAQPQYAEGQVWEYRTRPEDAGSLLRIQKMEPASAGGAIYHISFIGVHFAGGPAVSTLAHAPVSQESLDQSVLRLSTSKASFPDPADGIAQWRAARGGVFSVPIANVVAFVDRSIPRGAAQ
jgi:hypothetical protein